jgi:hypothetical protein
MEGSDHDLNKLLSWNLYVETEKNYENLSQESHCPGRNLNWEPPEQESDYILLESSCPVNSLLNDKICYHKSLSEEPVQLFNGSRTTL